MISFVSVAQRARVSRASTTVIRLRPADEIGSRRLGRLDRQGAVISFVSVAQRARVSRAFLYANAHLRGEIEALRQNQDGMPTRLPVRECASDSSIRARLRAALEENQRQRLEIAGLREELAHGRVRELELDRRVRRG